MTGKARKPHLCAVLLISLAALLSMPACDGKRDGPTVLPPVSPATTKPNPTLPPEPSPDPVATENTQLGAQAFVRYYIATLNRAYSTGDAHRLRELSTAECKSCANFLKTIDRVYPEGRLEGGEVVVKDIIAPPIIPEQPAVVLVVYTTTEFREVDSSGKVVRTADPEPESEFQFTLTRNDKGWRTDKVQVVE